MNADSLANRSLVHAKRTLPLRSLAVITALCLSGCGTSDKTADGPSLADLDAKSVDAVVDTGTPSDASADTNKDAVSLSCTSDLECLADLKESTCAKPRCVKGQCVQQALTKGTPCKPDGLEVAACQQTTCDGTGKCLFSPAADGKPCGEGKCGDACVAGKCVMGANKDDGDPCTETVCIGGIVSHQPITDPTFVCKDGGKCIDEGACIQGKCTGAKVLCDDGVACTIDFCQPGQGCMFLPANGLCDDGNPCTQSACDAKKGCASGPGKAGVPCDDGNKCTAKDACNGLGKCASGINTCGCSNDGECQVGADGAPAGDKCKPLACIGGKCEVNPKAEVVCPDSKQPCLASVCQSQTGKCSLVPAKQGKACDDGNACTLKSACASGKCAALIEADCDDKNKCTADKCDAKAGANGQGACVHSAIPGCGGGCQSHSACDDNNPCTQDTCGADGKCSHVTLDDCPAKQCKSAKDCPQPGAPCMQATCSDAGVCSVAAVPGCGGTGCQTGAACNDNNPCTKDTCGDDGKCSFTPIVGCKACTSSGACTDLNPCTTDTCTKGFCTHSATPGCKQCKTDSHCDDGNKCTKTACTGKLANGIGKCQSKPILGGGCDQCTSDSHCKDTNPCTTDKCGTTGVFKGKCQYNKVNCFDGKPCTYDVCDPAKGGCSHAKIPNCGSGCKNSTQCADNSPCITSYCSGGVCKSSIKNCNDNNACTFDACDNNTGKCVFSPIAGCSVGKCSAKEDCNDGDPCTYDTCSNFSGKCYNSTIPNCDPTAPKCKSVADCDDKKPCTNDYCSSFTGKCSHTNINNCVTGKYCKSKSDCDDKKKCTSNPCVGNKCQTVPITCNDYNPCTNDYCQSYTGKCIYTNKPGCTVEKCTTTSQCDDQNKCTLDTCLFGFCQHNLKPGCS